jgi:hypothetical protein
MNPFLNHACQTPDGREPPQGILLDVDGSLINNRTLPAALLPAAGSGGPSAGPGATLHSGIGHLLYGPSDCVYFSSATSTAIDTGGLQAFTPDGPASPADSMWCSPSLVFRRAQLGAASPASTAPIYLVDAATNRSSLVQYSSANEGGGGWQFTVAAQREYSFLVAEAGRWDLSSYR